MNEELNLKQVIKYTYQRKVIIILIVIISFIVGMLYTFLIKTPMYKVTAQILIDKSDASIEQVATSKELSQDKVKVEFDKTSKLITIYTEISNKEEALNITEQYIEKLQAKLQEVYDLKTFKIIEKPELPQQASNINHTKDMTIAIIIGIVIDGIYVLMGLSFYGLTNIFEIEEELKIKALGMVDLDNKKNKKQEIYITKNEKIKNQLKRVQANIILNKDNKKPQSIVLTGIKNGAGTSYITNNLAIQYSKLYSRILIIDADIKNKTLTKAIAEKGTERISNIVNIDNFENIILKTKIENVSILPIETFNIGEEEFLTDTALDLIKELKKSYDVILIDTLSINENVLPLCLSSVADATVLVAESGKVQQEDIAKAKIEIENVGGKISGMVLNKDI